MNTKLDFETIDMLSKGITQFAFRSGPVEEMHSRGKLTQKDMKTLNKFMANRIAGLLTTISNGDIANVLILIIVKGKSFAFQLSDISNAKDNFCKTL